MKTGAVLVVGDEILEGHTQDTNSHYLARRLAARGVRLRRIVTCGDDVDDIAARLEALLADRTDFIFVCGGIGPTPDDRTYEAVAIALHRPLVVTREDEAWMRQRAARHKYGQELLDDDATAEPLRRMVRRPEGSQAIENPLGMALGSAVDAGPSKVIVLPGVPRELQAMMEQVVEPLLLGPSQPEEAIAELEHVGQEASLYALLRDVESRSPGVRLGSYPQDDKGRVILRVQGPPATVRTALERLRKALPHARLVRAP